MKNKLFALTFAASLILAVRSADASSDVTAGTRVRVRIADVVQVDGVVNATRRNAQGKDVMMSATSDSVSVSAAAGERVNYPLGRTTFIGEILSVDDNTLVMKVDGREMLLHVPRSSVAKMDVSAGRFKKGGRGQAALRGVGIGMLTGAAVGFASGDDNSCPATRPSNGYFGSLCIRFSRSSTAIAGAIVVGGLGGLVGAAVGGGGGIEADKWKEFSLSPSSKVSVSVRPTGRGLSLRIGF